MDLFEFVLEVQFLEIHMNPFQAIFLSANGTMPREIRGLMQKVRKDSYIPNAFSGHAWWQGGVLVNAGIEAGQQRMAWWTKSKNFFS